MLFPVLDMQKPTVHMMEVEVSAGQPVSIAVVGPAADMLTSCPVHLEQEFGDLEVQLKDEYGMPQPPGLLMLCYFLNCLICTLLLRSVSLASRRGGRQSILPIVPHNVPSICEMSDLHRRRLACRMHIG
jgi:hypothetical protein